MNNQTIVLRLDFSLVVEYACRVEFLTLDGNIFGERLVLERMALVDPSDALDGLKNIFRLMASSPHRLAHLFAIELITPDGNSITHPQWLELLDLLTGTPLSTVLKPQTMPRVSSALRPFSVCFFHSSFAYSL